MRSFCCGADAAEQVDRRQARAQRLLGHVHEVLSRQHAFDRNADLIAEMTRDALVVAGQDLDLDTDRCQRLDGGGGIGSSAGRQK